MTRWLWAGLFTALVLCSVAFAWLEHPVCVPIPRDVVEGFKQWRPIEQRTDRQLHGPVFQWRGGEWYQCKSWISRQLFF